MNTSIMCPYSCIIKAAFQAEETARWVDRLDRVTSRDKADQQTRESGQTRSDKAGREGRLATRRGNKAYDMLCLQLRESMAIPDNGLICVSHCSRHTRLILSSNPTPLPVPPYCDYLRNCAQCREANGRRCRRNRCATSALLIN